jgi:Fur family ferric uptake transcriptional regulator
MSPPDASATPQRNTRQRAAVLAMLDSLTQFSTAQDIHARLRESGSTVGLTTVYRTLQSLADASQVDVLRSDDGEAMYRRCTDEHHHHLMCTRCGRTIEVDSPAVESWADEIASHHGFTDITHTLEISGICSDCG